MTSNSAYGTVGNVLIPQVARTFALTGVNGSFTAGQVITPGTLPTPLSCVAAEPGRPVVLAGLTLWEVFESASAVKPNLRLVFLDRSYTMPAKGSAFRIPVGAPEAVVGRIDIAAADWQEYDDDGTGTDGYAVVHVPEAALRRIIVPNSGTRSLYLAVLSGGTHTLATDAQLGGTATFERH